MTRRINNTTAVTSLADSKLMTLRANLMRLKVELTDAGDYHGTTLIVGRPETDAWKSVSWGSTIGSISALLGADLGVPREPVHVSLDALHYGLDDATRTGPGIEVIFDLMAVPRPHIELALDRIDADGAAAKTILGATVSPGVPLGSIQASTVSSSGCHQSTGRARSVRCGRPDPRQREKVKPSTTSLRLPERSSRTSSSSWL